MGEQRRRFSREFMLEAVRLAAESGKPLAQVVRALGIRPDMLREWKHQVEVRPGAAAADIFPGPGQLPSQDEERRRMRCEVEVLRHERECLREAAACLMTPPRSS